MITAAIVTGFMGYLCFTSEEDRRREGKGI